MSTPKVSWGEASDSTPSVSVSVKIASSIVVCLSHSVAAATAMRLFSQHSCFCRPSCNRASSGTMTSGKALEAYESRLSITLSVTAVMVAAVV